MISYDLHVHTTASDGLFTPAEIVEKAWQRGLKGIAITDHDAVAGVGEAIRCAGALPREFLVIPGIECNTNIEGQSVHVLGYGLDYDAEGLKERLRTMQGWREERARKMVEKLQGLGYAIDYETVRQKADGSVGRPHIARVLAESGAVPGEKWAFEHLLNRGRPAYVPRHPFTPYDAADLIHEFHGAAVLAHPGLVKNQKLVEELLDHEPCRFDGVEVHYPAHKLYQVEKYKGYAAARGLFITGGSDFHGKSSDEHAAYIGFRGLDDESFAVLAEKAFLNRKSWQ